MPRFPFSSYLRFRRRRLSGFRIFETRSVSLPRIQSTYSPIFRKISSAGNGRSYPLAFPLSPNGDALYVPVADPLAARRYISFHDLLPSHKSSFVRTSSRTKYKLSSTVSYLTTKKKLYDATTEDAVMRTWVASMDRFDVLVDAGNSPLLPSTATRYRSRQSSGLPLRTISSIYRFSIRRASRDPFCYIYYRTVIFFVFVRAPTSLFPFFFLSSFS